MKALLALSLTLGMSSAFAANESVEICNPENSSQFVRLSVSDNKITFISNDGSQTETKVRDIEKTIQATPADLNQAAASNQLDATLVSGTAYGSQEGGFLVATDAKNVKYLFLIFGPYTQLLGNSASCK